MTQTAIIDTTSRIIKRLTVDDVPSFDPTSESAVPMSSPISLSGWTVLGVEQVFTEFKSTNDATVPTTVKQAFVAFIQAFLQ